MLVAVVFFRTDISQSQDRGIALFCVRREMFMCATKCPCAFAVLFRVSLRFPLQHSTSLPKAPLDEKPSTRCLRSRFSLLSPSMRPPGHRRTLRPSARSRIVRRGPSGGVFSGRVLFRTTVSRRRRGACDCARRRSGTEVVASSLGKGIDDGCAY